MQKETPVPVTPEVSPEPDFESLPQYRKVSEAAVKSSSDQWCCLQ